MNKYAVIRHDKKTSVSKHLTLYPLTRDNAIRVIERENFSDSFTFYLISWIDFLNYYSSGKKLNYKRPLSKHIIPLSQSEKERLNKPDATTTKPADSFHDYLKISRRNIIQKHSPTFLSSERQKRPAVQR